MAAAAASYTAPANAPVYKIFDKATPDGEYAFQPYGTGVSFRSLLLPLATCVSQFKNATGAALLDCPRLSTVPR